MSTLVTNTENESQSETSVDVVELDELNSGKATGASLLEGNLDVIKNVKVTMEVVLGGAEMDVGELFELKSGSVVKLDRHVSAPLDIRLDNKVVARGELVAVEDNFGIRITEITSWK